MKRRTALGFIGGCITTACGASSGSSSPTPTSQLSSQTPLLPAYLGLNVGTEMNWTARRDSLLPYYQDAGVQWLRVWYNWASIETDPGSYNLNYVRPALTLAQEKGFRVTFVVWGTPDFAGNGALASDPDPNHFRRYCEWLKTNLADVVDAWEIGNETNLEKYFTGTPRDYVETLARAYPILSGEQLVIAAGPSGASKPDYWQSLIDNELEDFCDRVNLHPYQKDPDRVLRLVDDFKQRTTKPLWITELGLNTNVRGEEGKARFTATLLPELTDRVETIHWYRSIQGDRIHPQTFGLLHVDKETNEITRLPAYDAYKAFAQSQVSL